ncbi:MAG: hypothetical protein ABL997_14715 [Planctomycetota bacterium]
MARAVQYHLRVGDLVGRSLSIYFSNFLPFALLAALAFAPWFAVQLYIEANLAELDENSTALFLALAGIMSALASQMLTGALTYAVVQRLRGTSPSLGSVLAMGAKSFFRVLVVSLVVGILVGIGSVLLVVPGLILMTWFYVAIPVAVLEGKNLASLGRSRSLTDGNRWPIFGAVVLAMVIIGGIGAVIGIAIVANDLTMPAWVEFAINIVFGPFGAAMPATCYFLLRTGKENVDAKEVAAVFD